MLNYSKILVLIIFSLKNAVLNQDKYFIINYSTGKEHKYIQVHFEGQKQTTYMAMNQSSSFSWLPFDLFDPLKSPNLQTIETQVPIIISHIQTNASKLSDTIDQMEGHKVSFQSFHFYYANLTHLGLFPYLGFGSFFKDSNLSLTHLLYQNKIINNLIYSINPSIEEKGYGEIIFGDMPSQIVFGYYNAGCQIEDMYLPLWGCSLKAVGKYKNYLSSRFDISLANMVVPNDYLNYFVYKHNDMSRYFKDNNCTLIQDESKIRFRCLKEYINEYPNMTFEFNGGLYLEVNLERMLGCNEKFCMSNFYSDSTFGEVWILGHAFLKNYISSYNYISKNITFYSEKPLIKRKELIELELYEKYIFISKIIIVVDIIIISSMVIPLILILNIFKKVT